MTSFSYTLPVAGTTLNSIADPEIASALQTLLTWGNGNIDGVNVTAAFAQSASVNQGAQTVKGASIIATSQSVTSTTYTTLATPDQITGLAVPANGLLRVWYNATWQESVASAARAAIFIGSNQLKVPYSQFAGGPVTEAAYTGSASPVNTNYALASCPIGLIGSSQSAYSGDVTTDKQGIATAASGIELGGVVELEVLSTPIGFGGPCDVDNLPAATYTISVQFKSSSGSVTVSNRRLRAQVISFS